MALIERVHVWMFAFLTLQTLALGILIFSRGWCQNMTHTDDPGLVTSEC